MPLGEQIVVDAGLVVKAVHKAAADHIDEVFIALLVFAQQDQVAVVARARAFVGQILADVHLAADDGMDAAL